MKKLIIIISLISLSIVIACMNPKNDNNGNQASAQTFASTGEAAIKAKSDFIELLHQSKDINMGVSATDLERSQTGNALELKQLDFNKILKVDTLTDINQLGAEYKSSIIPFMSDNKVLAVAILSHSEKGYAVAGLGDRNITDELNAVKEVTKNENIQIFEVPNLNFHIYSTKVDSLDMYYANYNDMLNIKQGVSLNQLSQILISSARNFEKEYGKLIKENQLVK